MSLDVTLTCTHCQTSVYDANITHNLTSMADAAGIYDVLWHPEENGITRAGQLVEPLRAGIAMMEADPARFRKHNPINGWGDYAGFVPWLKRYLFACEKFPQAEVSSDR